VKFVVTYYPHNLDITPICYNIQIMAGEITSVCTLRKLIADDLLEKELLKEDEKPPLIAIVKDQII